MAGPLVISTIRSRTTQFWFNGPVAQVLFQAGPIGSRVSNCKMGTSQSASLPTFQYFRAEVLTDNLLAYPNAARGRGQTPILSVTKGAPDTITRTNGSFLQDGHTIGQRIALLNDTGNQLNNLVGLIHASTAVTAGVITMAGSNLFNASGACGPGAQLVRVIEDVTRTVVASSGFTNAAIPQIGNLDPTLDPTLAGIPDNFLLLFPNEMIIGYVSSGAVTTGNTLSVTIEGGDY